jgi:hypothetical protein
MGVMQAKQGFPTCEQIDPKEWDSAAFAQSEDLIKNPLAHFAVIGDDLLVNGVSIMEFVSKANVAYEHAGYGAFGYYIGEIMKLATQEKVYPHQEWVEERKTSPVVEKVDRKDVASMAQGFLEATRVGTINFTALLECIYVADQDAEALDMGVKALIDAYNTKSVQEGVAGLMEMVSFYQGLKQVIPVCKSVDAKSLNWGTFDNIVNMLEDPIKHISVIDKEIVLNGATITKEIGQSLEAWRSGDYKSFGYEFGSTLRDTCEPALFLV